MTDTAYRILPRGGGIIEHVIPPGGLPIGGDTRLLSGDENENWRPWTMTRVAEIVARCAPWVTTWCGPHIACDDDGDTCGGRCLPGSQVLAIATGPSAPFAMGTAYHEVGHALCAYLLPGALATLDAATGGLDWPGAYLSSRDERRARFIEHSCMALDAGAMLHLAPGSATETAWQVYSGDIARQRDAAIEAREAAMISASRPSLFRRARELVHG